MSWEYTTYRQDDLCSVSGLIREGLQYNNGFGSFGVQQTYIYIYTSSWKINSQKQNQFDNHYIILYQTGEWTTIN
jgi:hypothetical protein